MKLINTSFQYSYKKCFSFIVQIFVIGELLCFRLCNYYWTGDLSRSILSLI